MKKMLVIGGPGRSASTYITNKIIRDLTKFPYPFFQDRFLGTRHYSYQSNIQYYSRVVRTCNFFQFAAHPNYEQTFLYIVSDPLHLAASIMKMYMLDQNITQVLKHLNNMGLERGFNNFSIDSLIRKALEIYSLNVENWANAKSHYNQNFYIISPFTNVLGATEVLRSIDPRLNNIIIDIKKLDRNTIYYERAHEIIMNTAEKEYQNARLMHAELLNKCS